jgi:hypothetical protein
MIEARRRAYLEALGFDVWIARPPAPEPGRLGVGTGRGSTLLICRSAADCTAELASDLARALGGDPLWSWLDPAAGDEAEFLADIVASRLITRVLLFGRAAARSLFQGPPSAMLGSVEIVEAPGLEELVISASARKTLWRRLQSAAGAGGAA